MYSPGEREALRSELLESAAQDPRIGAAAITGSAALDRQDSWSDIDLAFGIADEADLPGVLAHWTHTMYERYQALHHVDVRAGAWIYRVFLLANTLQVDLAFVGAREFRALAPAFRLVFGKPNQPGTFPEPKTADLIGMAWLHALHARSSLARRKLWQAEYMITGIRNHVFALACLRHNLPAAHGRGIDQLPAELVSRMENSLVLRLDVLELSRSFQVLIAELLGEIDAVDSELAARLKATLFELVFTG